jgi:hypothetical protein
MGEDFQPQVAFAAAGRSTQCPAEFPFNHDVDRLDLPALRVAARFSITPGVRNSRPRSVLARGLAARCRSSTPRWQVETEQQ